MKTLDEVIKVFETGMLFSDKPYDEALREFNSDALHYLKEYKNTDEKYKKAIAHVTEVVDYYEKMVADYLAVNNPPLTWDELKSMEGKPVWMELLKGSWKGWDVVGGFTDDDFGEAMVTVRLDDYYKADLGKMWQAYQKERS